MMSENAGVVTDNQSPMAAAVETSPADEGASSEVNWTDMATDFADEDQEDFATVEGDAEVIEEGSPAIPPTASEVPSTETPAAQAETPPPTPATPPAIPPATPPTGEAPPSSATQEAPSNTDTISYQDWRTEQVSKLEQVYALSEDSAQAMLTEPETVLPKMAAQMHMHVVESVFNAVMQALPQVVQATQTQQTVESKAEELFFGANPDLRDPKFREPIQKLGMMYRSMNKTASPEEAVKAIGNLVRAAMGMRTPGATPPTAQTPAAVVQSAPAPFAPVRGGGSAVTPSKATDNVFAALAEEMMQDED